MYSLLGVVSIAEDELFLAGVEVEVAGVVVVAG
jgi:hypothetical protein